LGGEHGLFDRRQVTPYPASTVLRFPHVAHLSAFGFIFALAHESNYRRFAAMQQENCAVHKRQFMWIFLWLSQMESPAYG
jgi:hypothetical protein